MTVPVEILEIRKEVCERCDEKCQAFISKTLNPSDACESCPREWLGRWGQYGDCKKDFGLGDAVASLAQPFARAIDRIVGTKIAECGGCKKRRAALNRAMPDITKPFS